MGLFDDVYCEADLPTGHPESERSFQTKSLGGCLDRFTITRAGQRCGSRGTRADQGVRPTTLQQPDCPSRGKSKQCPDGRPGDHVTQKMHPEQDPRRRHTHGAEE